MQRPGEHIVPGHTLFPWMLRHAARSHDLFQPESHRGRTLWDVRAGTFHKGPLLPFMEGLWRKLDVQWLKRIWVGKLHESDGQVVLTPHGWLETSEFSPIKWENTRVESMIQPCLKPNF